MNKQDTISQRSFLPAGLNLSINGTIVVAGAGTFFFNENRFRIYMNYGYRNEPSHYYGKGFEKRRISKEEIPLPGFTEVIFNCIHDSYGKSARISI